VFLVFAVTAEREGKSKMGGGGGGETPSR